MMRHCDGTDPNLVRADADGYVPCSCGAHFNDEANRVVWPHHPVAAGVSLGAAPAPLPALPG